MVPTRFHRARGITGRINVHNGGLSCSRRVKGCDETIATVHLDATASVGIDWLFKLKPSAVNGDVFNVVVVLDS